MSYVIKELTNEILKRYKGFFETLSNLSSSPRISYKNSKKILKKINKQKGHIFVAVLKKEKQIIGAATILIEQKFIRGGRKAGHIEDVVVMKKFEGKGIGKNLIKRCEDFAKKEKCYRITLDCDDKNIVFYKKCGFYEHENCMRKNI
jgi:glucosamine-phosphate N-acetyltransferase